MKKRPSTLSRVEIPGGFIAGDSIHAYLHDHQGNVRRVVNTHTGAVEQETHYYPFGMPFGESTATALRDINGSAMQPRRYGGKESVSLGGFTFLDFPARPYDAATARFLTPDPLQEDYAPFSPYLYCAANPINLTDPTGCEIRGIKKKDAQLAVQDFRDMFPGKEFEGFRGLIVQSGKKQDGNSLARISQADLTTAFSGITLNEDQKALVDMVVNTINSDDIHQVEYINPTGNLSSSAENVFAPLFDHPDLPISTILSANNGFPVDFIRNQGGGGATTATKNGTYSLIFKDSSFHINGRAVTTGHEIIGHGRSLAVGRGDLNQHVDAIQTEKYYA